MRYRQAIVLLLMIAAMNVSACAVTPEQATEMAATSVEQSSAPQLQVVKAFGESPHDLPEGVAIDQEGNLYVSLGPPFFVGGGYGAIRRIQPDGTEQTLFELPAGPAPAGVAVDDGGNVYFALPNPGQSDVGVYRLTDAGGSERIPGTEDMAVPNGLAFDDQGNLYASDSILGSIWRMPGTETNAEPWFSHDWLLGCGEEDAIGANGVSFRDGMLYVASLAKGMLVQVPILSDGSPGEPAIVAGTPECNSGDLLHGMDGIAVGKDGIVYAMLVLPHKLVRIDPTDGATTILLDEEDGLWNPASIVFGTRDQDAGSVYVTNYAVLPPEPANSLGAALLRYDIEN
jgi:sugar lactone lactonase YvrE